MRTALAIAAGLLLTVAMPPTGAWPLLASLAIPFALSAGAPTLRAAFGVGAWFAFGFFVLYIAWLPLSFSAPSLLGPGIWALHPLLLLVLMAMWGGTTALARGLGGGGHGTLLLLAPLWVLVEHLRSLGIFAFPWGTLGYAWVDAPIGQLAPYLGVTGLSLLTSLSAALLAAPWVIGEQNDQRPLNRVAPALSGIAVIVAATLLGSALTPTDPYPSDHRALLVQGNIDPFGRASTQALELEVHLDLSRAGAAAMAVAPDLIIWPEGALTGGFLEGLSGASLLAQIQATAPESAFVVGGRGIAAGGTSNAAFTIAEGALLGRYDKFMLVPFGEFFPWLDALAPLYRFAFNLVGLPLLQNIVAGEGPANLPSPIGELGVGICYESVFPRVSAAMARAGAEVLVIITNDAWFARGDGARQHLDMGRMRAIETRRWLLRAGNDGITAVIDPNGRVVRELPRMIEGSLVVSFGLRDDVTFYARHAERLGWVLVGLTLLGLAAARLRERQPL
jgi:apolipoprotein N-acyltransferase